MNGKLPHILIIGNPESWQSPAIEFALTYHFPEYESDCRKRTRISVLVETKEEIHDFVFEYQELFDNSYWRTVDLTAGKPSIEGHCPQYEGLRKDFVDIEWEFIICRLSNPILQEKIRRWASDRQRVLTIALCFPNSEKNKSYEEKLRRRLPDSVSFEIIDCNPEVEAKRMDDLMDMARYLNYFYKISYEKGVVPTELPEEEVEKAWSEIPDERLRMSNLYNVMSIPMKMRILGHDSNDWDKFYALTADEIEKLTAVEHNRWCVERLIQGSRPCTDTERKEIEEDRRRRLNDAEYAKSNPVSLKKKYKNERNAHYDLCAFSELGVDETGLHVSRYDRDLTAAIPLIVKTFNDRHHG